MTRGEFEIAVRDALSHYTRLDLLTGNPLLQARVVAQSGPSAATAQDLRDLLARTADQLFSNAHDQKLHRALDLTYFHPAPKQEAAAERSGLSFSTYRRYLTAGVCRLTDWLWRQEQEASGGERMTSGTVIGLPGAQPDHPSASPPRLSIVVLPFLNLAQNAPINYLVDAITDSLITDFSQALPGSFVVSRSTAFTYKDRQVPIRQLGQELRVRYVLEGSVLADDATVRINVRLIDARTDEHLWAERFDKERRDILRVHDEIVARICRSAAIEMIRNEVFRNDTTDTSGSNVNDLVLRAQALATAIKHKAHAVEATELFRRALALDPNHVDALAGTAAILIYQVVNQYQTGERTKLLDEAEALVSRAMRLASDNIHVLKARAFLLRARGRFSEALIAAQAVIALSPGEATAYSEVGLNHLYLGATEQAISWFRRADRIAPRDRVRWTWLQGLGRALMHLGQDEDAAATLRLAVDCNPDYAPAAAYLAAAEALTGNITAARAQISKFAQLDPGITIKSFVEDRSPVPLDAVSAVYLKEFQRILEGLRRAGMPDGLTSRMAAA